MSISPPSEPRTVFLWGDRWWVPGRESPITFAATERAAATLIAAFADDRPRRLRLIYQPDGFTSLVTPCPKAGRRTMALALQEQFPGLATEEIAWSHDPILSLGQGLTTVLHYESSPALFGLLTELASAGLAVESVWPLSVWLQALPGEWSDSGASTVLVVDDDRACAYHHPADGPRQVILWPHEGLGSPRLWLANLLDRNPSEPVLVITRETAADCDWLPAGDRPGLRHLTLADALSRPATIPSRHPAQLVPTAPIVTAARAVLVASVALLMTAVGISGWWMNAQVQARKAVLARTAQEKMLATEVAHLRGNATEISALRSERAGRPVTFAGSLLRGLAATIPAEVTLATLQAEAGSHVARGFLAPSTDGSVLDRWRATLGRGDQRAQWQIESPSKPGESFRLHGQNKS